MARIVFIAPNSRLYEVGQQIIADMGLSHQVDVYQAILRDGVTIARRAEAEGVDVIVSRGGTAEMIKKSGVRTPVIEVPITGPDLAQALLDAKKVTGLENPKIAVLAFENMMYDIELFSKLLNLNLTVYELGTDDDIPAAVEKAAKDKVDIVIGGIMTTRLAAMRGLDTLILSSGESAFRVAFLEAEKVAGARMLEKEKTQQFQVLVDCSMEGIIGVDRENIILVFNPAASKILGKSAATIIGTDIRAILPEHYIVDCLQHGKECLGDILRINQVNVLLNIAPIKVADEITGAIVTFQEASRIVEMEEKIRKELYSKGLVAQYRFDQILGVSREITEIKRIAQEFSLIDATVLISGASGTGKELFAQSMHNSSLRKKGPFVAVNCASFPANLMESELFGYVEGAFTGANRKGKPGLFELAHKGTIFLDEISEMDKYGQSRLLRVLQERQVRRLGDDKNIPVDVRITAASNRNLLRLVREGSFREDLYYRLNVLTLNLPALKERRGDIRYLAEYFLQEMCKKLHRELSLEDEAIQLLKSYEWTGNVRELKNFMERLAIMARGPLITPNAINAMFQNREFDMDRRFSIAEPADVVEEKKKIISMLRSANYNQTKAAELLGMDRSTLYRKMKRYEIGLGLDRC
ncbi:MAG TPA: sigma 54-interacting transcriptional regulator [Negativicutes bacterium]|nr:sigma 54-interacting transcriptional regulator [Negativicutes bacterium]